MPVYKEICMLSLQFQRHQRTQSPEASDNAAIEHMLKLQR